MENRGEARQDYYSAELSKHLLTEIKEYAIFMVDLNGILSTWNPGVKRLLGYSEEEFIGKKFDLIFTRDDQKQNIPDRELQNALKTGRAEDKRWHLKKDGSVFWANGLVTSTKDDNGAVSGFVKIMRDETEQRNYETQITNYANKLKATNTDLKNFAGIVSHDLSAPLRTIVGFTSIVEEKARGIDEEVDTSINHIREGAERMLTLVDELLQFTSATSQELVLEAVEPNLVVQHALDNLSIQLLASRARVECDPLPEVMADQVQLGRIFQNLIENAIKYRKPNVSPYIKIYASQIDGEIVLSVSDNGLGLDSDKQEKIFNLFNRSGNPSAAEGYGIGLATCRRIVELFGGKLWVESRKGEGSTFNFSVKSVDVALSSPVVLVEPKNTANLH